MLLDCACTSHKVAQQSFCYRNFLICMFAAEDNHLHLCPVSQLVVTCTLREMTVSCSFSKLQQQGQDTLERAARMAMPVVVGGHPPPLPPPSPTGCPSPTPPTPPYISHCQQRSHNLMHKLNPPHSGVCACVRAYQADMWKCGLECSKSVSWEHSELLWASPQGNCHLATYIQFWDFVVAWLLSCLQTSLPSHKPQTLSRPRI